jgi:hypothetical protein
MFHFQTKDPVIEKFLAIAQIMWVDQEWDHKWLEKQGWGFDDVNLVYALI